MLPPGHIAAGYLTAKALLHFSHSNFSSAQQASLVWWGVAFGIAPDLDMAYSFYKQKGYRVIGKETPNHRKYFSHAPALWLAAGLLVYFLATSLYAKYIGLLLWLASWVHFLLDSFDYGIMWLWPLDKKIYSFRNREVNFEIPEPKNPHGYLWSFIKQYSRVITFYLEILVVLSALTVYFK